MRTTLIRASLLVAAAVLAAVPTASAGPVGLADFACDTAVEPLQAECALGCDQVSPPLQGACQRLEYGGSVWYLCTTVLGPVPACDSDTYKCTSHTLYTVRLLCERVVNPALDRA